MKRFLFCMIIMIMCFFTSFVNADTLFYDTRGTKYEGVVERIAKLGIVNGISDTTFAPNRGVTRAELAKIIVKMRGLDDLVNSVEYKKIFSDVDKSDWFCPYVIIANDLELINGYEDGTFKPNNEVSYAELIAILLRDLGYTNIKQDSPNGWYWNYIIKMREIGLNKNIGEFDYTKSAKRGDVVLFAWNTLITNRWAIAVETENDGFIYTYSNKTPLETYFKDYNFLNDVTVDYIGGKEEEIIIGVDDDYFYVTEKTPLYALGGHISALYNNNDRELFGVSFDSDYGETRVVSGPISYVKDLGYNLQRARSYSYGDKNDATYVYLVLSENDNEIIRAVYVEGSNSLVVNSVVEKLTDESGDRSTLKNITINEDEYSSYDIALMDDGLAKDISTVKNGDVITNLGNGLLVYSNSNVSGTLTDIDVSNDMLVIDGDIYYVLENCICYLYQDKSPYEYYDFSSKELKNYIGSEINVTLNTAEEVAVINFGKVGQTNKGSSKIYKIGFVVESQIGVDNIQRVIIDYGDEKSRRLSLNVSGNSYLSIGDMISLCDDGTYVIVTKDQVFNTSVSVKYNYEAKSFGIDRIGEYMVTDDTYFYKVNLSYENNSLSMVNSCDVSKIKVDDLKELSAYHLAIVYDEDMEITKLFAISELNKFENQIALVKKIDYVYNGKDGKIPKVTLSVVGGAIKKFDIYDEVEKYVPGDIITFTYEEKGDSDYATLDEAFSQLSIGYKRDLVVDDFNKNIVTFKNGNAMNLNEDIYDYNDVKINLNNYRFVIANVSKNNDAWTFSSVSIADRNKINIEENDRFAIGELDNVIVIYRGFEK